jgi:hypothetical protein
MVGTGSESNNLGVTKSSSRSLQNYLKGISGEHSRAVS